MKALEQEVIRLREAETRLVGRNQALQARVGQLEQTLAVHAIPIPQHESDLLSPAVPGDVTSTGLVPAATDTLLSAPPAQVTLQDDGSGGHKLSVDMPPLATMSSPTNLIYQTEPFTFKDSRPNWSDEVSSGTIAEYQIRHC